MRETARLRRWGSTAAGVAGVILMAGYLVGAQGDTAAHDIAEKFAQEATKPDAQARKRADADKRKAQDARRKSEEADMLARARAEAEARREEMLKAREAAELADTQRREEEEKADLAVRQAAQAAEELRHAEALRKSQEDQRLAEQRAAEAKRYEEAQRQAEAQRRAEEERRLAENRKAEEEARTAALRREEEARAQAARQAEALRKAEDEHRLAQARRAADEAMRRADEERRVAERAREQEQAARASEQALRSRLEAERELEGERLADRLRQARVQREARVTTNSSAAPPRDVIEQGSTAGAEAAGLVVDPRATRVAVLLLMQPGDRGIRRHNKSADPVLCGEGECYISNGSGREANLLPARKALGFFRTWGQRAGACNNSLGCVFRGVDLARLDRLVMPVDMRVVRHDRREMREVMATSKCHLERGRLACADTVHSDDYMMWIVPESLAVKAGADALERALADGLPTGQTAFAPSRTF